jgi:hypothetical protein
MWGIRLYLHLSSVSRGDSSLPSGSFDQEKGQRKKKNEKKTLL